MEERTPKAITIPKESIIYEMSALNAPVLRVAAKSRIIFETNDCFEGQIKSAEDGFAGFDWNKINPATGSVFIEEAEPGDILSVKIESIELNEFGVCVCGAGWGALGHLITENCAKIIQIEGDYALFDNLKLPLNKMVGVIGVAPADGKAVKTGEPGEHGGNMDCKAIAEGATVYLPVNVSGALLALGDLHAVMADGEIGVSGLEIGGRVTVTVDVIKNKKMPLPMVCNKTHIITIASDANLDTACNKAIENMAEILAVHGFGINEATMLISMAGDLRICQIVNPKKTARVEFPKEYIGMQ